MMTSFVTTKVDKDQRIDFDLAEMKKSVEADRIAVPADLAIKDLDAWLEGVLTARHAKK